MSNKNYIYIYIFLFFFEPCLFGLFLMFVVSSFETSALNVLPTSFVAGVGDPTRNGAVRNISSVIWGSSPVRRDFRSALLMVCMFRSMNSFDMLKIPSSMHKWGIRLAFFIFFFRFLISLFFLLKQSSCNFLTLY